ncbi:MAG: iron ABC transporter permease [Bacteroidetes bacterium]|nr:MAG: iron ABC transporter permease [Bacteroidota bacterium]RLD49445.1 MAG: iron ABC transporter permease [Bacteroidota bacterium]RLD74650.1 MAG: iron ABC transporter permease [Bacteroidota bacterium]
MHKQGRTGIWFLIFSVLTAVLFLANLWYGSVLISWKDVLAVLVGQSGEDSVYEVIILNYRLPQAITALAVGIALSVAGLVLQTVFRNPLAGPSVLGISSGASLGVAIVVSAGSLAGLELLNQSYLVFDIPLVLAAVTGSLLVLLIIIFVAQRISNVVTILIIGIMIGYTVSAVVGVIQFFSREEELHAYILWGLGSFSKTNNAQAIFLLVISVLLTIVVLSYSKGLNALLLGTAYARSSGINVKVTQNMLLVVAGLLVALGTVFTGPVAFVGLAVPHLARNFFKTSAHGLLIPAVIVMGASLTLACNLAAKLPGYDTSLPINAVTSLIGAPVVIWVIVKRGKVKKT